MRVYVANPRGYCEGVVRAINLALSTRRQYPQRPIVVLGMLVHNEDVINTLNNNQITTINPSNGPLENQLAALDQQTIVIFTAHGHPHIYERIAKKKGLMMVDATCPKVQTCLDIIKVKTMESRQIIYIGQTGHPETIAALNQQPNIFLYDTKLPFDYQQITEVNPLVINQTTLSVDELASIHQEIRDRLPAAEFVDEICDATRRRQRAVKAIASDVDIIYIIGSQYSSNTKRLFEIAGTSHPTALIRRINSVAEINLADLKDKQYVGVASGASTPPEVANAVIDYLRAL